ncbi:hypothetical protein DEO72_LG5g867 [Vigna unguiculata]|uniref:Uncharacterized protein n=1 Tax=Vigna unguiculata TaxID=3917 RepID=A0A4D6LWQ9_VIGUN|nr:hypothetical protein DEO72_LG5g867 [Vigna unguiculata]
MVGTGEAGSLVMNTDCGPYWELHSVLRIVVRNWIIPVCDLSVVASRWKGHELELVATIIILRISSKVVGSRGRQWKK